MDKEKSPQLQDIRTVLETRGYFTNYFLQHGWTLLGIQANAVVVGSTQAYAVDELEDLMNKKAVEFIGSAAKDYD